MMRRHTGIQSAPAGRGVRAARWAGVLTLLTILAGGPSGAAQAAPIGGAIIVFAAASLTEAFTAIGKVLEASTPGQHVVFNFAGSQQLALQIEQGAGADVFASADERWMTYLRQRHFIAGQPRPFARNRLVVVTPRSNPGKITRLQDLARPGVRLVIEADAVPAGHYAREAFAKLDRAPGFDRDYAQRVLHNVVSEEDNVRAVLVKVELGEADAGTIYQSDVTPAAAAKVLVLDVPDPYNVVATYPIARVRGGNAAGGALFADAVLSPRGQLLLRESHFIPVTDH